MFHMVFVVYVASTGMAIQKSSVALWASKTGCAIFRVGSCKIAKANERLAPFYDFGSQ
jgi:hypothetical protein